MSENNLKGIVISTKMNKTAVVSITKKIKHSLYGKFVKCTTKLFVHDENNFCIVGDTVLIKKTSPFSKKKNWVFLNKV